MPPTATQPSALQLITITLLLLLPDINAALAESVYRSTSVMTVQARLYLKIGDFYAARQEYERAAEAYQRAAKLAAGSLTAEEQIAIAERLSSVQDVDPAIADLQRIRRQQPGNLRARLILARYLAWNNRPREAAQVADEVLAIEPDNLAAKTIKATVSSWRGDYATAVPLFEEVLKQEEDFDTRLSYYHALASLGNYLWASDVTAQFRPQNEFQSQALEDLQWTLMRNSATNLQYQQEYYHDSLKNSHTAKSLRLELPWHDTMASLALGRNVAADGYGYSFALSRIELGLKGAIGNASHASGGIGMARYDNFDTGNVTTANLRVEHTFADLQLGAEYRHDAYDDFTYIVFNQIKTSKGKLELDYHPSDFWNLKLDYLHTDYSDHNRSELTTLALRYAIHHTPPRISIGYQIEQLSFRTQTFHGYYDPDLSQAHKALLAIYKWTPHYEWGIEGFAGHQDVSRLGIKQKESIAGWESFIRAQLIKHFMIEASWEGANYGIDKPYLYRYHLLKLSGVVMF